MRLFNRVLFVGVPTLTPSVITVPIGQSASFSCSAVGDPLPQITWYRETNQITNTTSRVTITGSTFTLSDIAREDRGYYTCRAVFQTGFTEARAFLNILRKSEHFVLLVSLLLLSTAFRPVPPSFQNQTLRLTAVPSTEMTLPCAVFPDPTLAFSWFFEGVSLSTSGGSFNISEDGSLVISSVQAANEGTFTCMARNSLGTANGTVFLDVLSKLSLLSHSIRKLKSTYLLCLRFPHDNC